MGLSTFSSLHIADRGIQAARQQIAITGQNTANAGTVGYTRQSAALSSLPGVTGPGLFPGAPGAGQGVQISSIDRAASEFANRQVRTGVAQSGFQTVRAEAYSGIEDILREPGDNSVSSALNDFFSAWQDVANDPGQEAATATLYQNAVSFAGRLNSDHSDLSDQWNGQHQALSNDVDTVNVLAERFAAVNNTIRQHVANGGSPNELLDARDQLAEQMSALTGGTLRVSGNGTADFLVGGTPLVDADGNVNTLVATPTNGPGDDVTVEWAHRPGSSAGVNGGSIAGRLLVLSPDGPMVETMGEYNDLAASIARSVNALHQSGTTVDGDPGQPFFSFDPANPAATLSVAINSADEIAAGSATGGALDGSIADEISQLAPATSREWAGFVTGTGAASKSALNSLSLASASESSARGTQLSLSSVDLDEEAVNLMTFQHGFQASSRVLTAVDEMLDIIINRTGLVGR